MWPLPETAMGVLCNCLLGAIPITLRDAITPLVRGIGSPPGTTDPTRPPAVGALDIMHGRSRMAVDPGIPTQCRDGVRRVFTDQADIACTTKSEAP